MFLIYNFLAVEDKIAFGAVERATYKLLLHPDAWERVVFTSGRAYTTTIVNAVMSLCGPCVRELVACGCDSVSLRLLSFKVSKALFRAKRPHRTWKEFSKTNYPFKKLERVDTSEQGRSTPVLWETHWFLSCCALPNMKELRARYMLDRALNETYLSQYARRNRSSRLPGQASNAYALMKHPAFQPAHFSIEGHPNSVDAFIDLMGRYDGLRSVTVTNVAYDAFVDANSVDKLWRLREALEMYAGLETLTFTNTFTPCHNSMLNYIHGVQEMFPRTGSFVRLRVRGHHSEQVVQHALLQNEYALEGLMRTALNTETGIYFQRFPQLETVSLHGDVFCRGFQRYLGANTGNVTLESRALPNEDRFVTDYTHESAREVAEDYSSDYEHSESGSDDSHFSAFPEASSDSDESDAEFGDSDEDSDASGSGTSSESDASDASEASASASGSQ